MSTEKNLSLDGKWSTFYLAGEMFAVPVADVQEVLMHQPLTPVPLAPEHIVGLLNLRGHIMPAIDLRRRLRFPIRDASASSTFLVLKSDDKLFSVVVDEIGDVLELPGSSWRPPPDTVGAEHVSFGLGICPIEGHMVIGLRVAALVADDEPRTGSQAAA